MTTNRKIFKSSTIFVALLFLVSCGEDSKKKTDTATQGNFTILADESFAPVIHAEEYIFESLYNRAHINFKYISEGEALQSFINDTAESMIIGRKLSSEEIGYLRNKKYSAQQTLIALEGLTIIANKSFKDSVLSLEKLKKILTGEMTNWKEVNKEFNDAPIKVTLDKSNSSTLLALKNYFKLNEAPPAIFASGSTQNVLEYVKNNNYTIGVIGYGFISDEEDPSVINIKKEIKVLGIELGGKIYYPDQENIRDSLYPLIRGIYSINKGSRAGLGVGFSTFMASDRGQRIIMKLGLLPAKVPGREIEIAH